MIFLWSDLGSFTCFGRQVNVVGLSKLYIQLGSVTSEQINTTAVAGSRRHGGCRFLRPSRVGQCLHPGYRGLLFGFLTSGRAVFVDFTIDIPFEDTNLSRLWGPCRNQASRPGVGNRCMLHIYCTRQGSCLGDTFDGSIGGTGLFPLTSSMLLGGSSLGESWELNVKKASWPRVGNRSRLRLGVLSCVSQARTLGGLSFGLDIWEAGFVTLSSSLFLVRTSFRRRRELSRNNAAGPAVGSTAPLTPRALGLL